MNDQCDRIEELTEEEDENNNDRCNDGLEEECRLACWVNLKEQTSREFMNTVIKISGNGWSQRK